MINIVRIFSFFFFLSLLSFESLLEWFLLFFVCAVFYSHFVLYSWASFPIIIKFNLILLSFERVEMKFDFFFYTSSIHVRIFEWNLWTIKKKYVERKKFFFFWEYAKSTFMDFSVQCEVVSYNIHCGLK